MCKVLDLFDRCREPSEGRAEATPYIEECRGRVRLYFDALEVQSEMLKNAPTQLTLRYTRTMVGALNLKSTIRHIGMIGLGGGSIPKYCYRHFPNTKISVAEINSAVISLRDRFRIPMNDHRFTVYCEDGADFVRRHAGRFDALFVDGFDRMGQSPQLCSSQFYLACSEALVSDGLLIVNLGRNRSLIPRIRSTFQNQVILADDEVSYTNTVLIAGKGASSARLKTSAIASKSRLG